MLFVYVLRSLNDGKRYIGMTDKLDRRLWEHNKGKVSSTRYRKPFILKYSENFETRKEARVRERYFKSAAGRRFLDTMEENFDKATRPND